MPSEHRAAAFNRGCRCPSCREANRTRLHLYRRRKHDEAMKAFTGPTRLCVLCGRSFRARGLATHEWYCTG